MEAVSESDGELAGAGEESRWAALEGGSDVDDELAQMRLQMSGGSEPAAALPEGQPQDSHVASGASSSAVDDDLEELRRQLNS